MIDWTYILLNSEHYGAREVRAVTLVAAISQSSVAIAICDTDFRLHFFNPAAASLFGIPETGPSKGPGPSLSAQVPGIDVPAVRAAIQKLGFWRERRTIVSGGEAATSREGDIEVSAFHDGYAARLMIVAHEVEPGTSLARRVSDTDLINGSPHLTPREKDVMLGLLTGHSNKMIGRQMAISPRTVEFHRAKLMRRFGAASLVDLIQKVVHEERADARTGVIAAKPSSLADLAGALPYPAAICP